MSANRGELLKYSKVHPEQGQSSLEQNHSKNKLVNFTKVFMTSTNTDALNQVLKDFKRLPVDEQLAALGSIYAQVGSSVSSASGTASSKDVRELTDQVKEMRQEDQLQFMRDVFSSHKNDQDEVALDPHPTKAMLELIPGVATPPLTRYQSLNANSRLAFWYQFAQEMGTDDVISMPTNYQPSSKTTEVLDTLKSCDFDQQVSFLSQVV